MKPKSDPTQSRQSPPFDPAPRRRFRIQKLEERIAPRKGGNGTNNCTLTFESYSCGASGNA